MRKKIVILTALFVFFLEEKSFSQQQAYFENITEEHGLSDNHITSFLKDRAGYLWIGTESGLNRYDGNRFKIYSSSATAKNHLSNAFITAIKEDSAGSIWVATRKGLNRIDQMADTTETIASSVNKKNIDLSRELIWDVFPDSDTSVWIAIDAKDFIRFNPKNKQFFYYDFRMYLQASGIEFTPFYHSVFKVLPKSDDELWLATTEGIFSFTKTTGQFKLEAGAALDEITFFSYHPENKKLYCADERKILYIYEPGVQKLVKLNTSANVHIGKFIAPYSSANKLLFIPAPEGLVLVNSNNEIVAFLKGILSSENNLLSGIINTVYTDRDSITWIGTRRGISKFVPRLNANLHISFPENLVFDPEYSLKNFVYYAPTNEWLVASFKDNTIWKVNNQTGFTSVFSKPAEFKNDICYALYSRHPDTLFFLCDGSLLINYVATSKWERVLIPAPWKDGSLTSMTIDAVGNYWLGTRRRGLITYWPKEKKIKQPGKDYFSKKIIHALEYDAVNDCIWIAAYGSGLHRYHLKTDSIERIQRDDDNPLAIHSSLINDIITDREGNVWAATLEGGLAKYNPRKNSANGVTNYDRKIGLPDDNIYSLDMDPQGNTWFTTIKGIGVLRADGKNSALYNMETGLPYSKFQQTIRCLPDGKIATIIENNLLCFDPTSLLQKKDYPMQITEVLINDSLLFTGNHPIFNYYHNTLRFEFAILDFVSPGAIEYFYKLEGVEKDWISNGKSHTVRYPSLPPGNYVFLVKARKPNGEFYQQSANWPFTIKPAFWQTSWFKLILVVLMATLIYTLFKRRVGEVREKAAIKQQLTEMEVRALRAQMNPHFIFNAMNSIQQFTLRNDMDNANLYLSKFSTLLRRVLHTSQQVNITLTDEIEQLNLYLDIEQRRMGNEFEYEIIVDKEIETDAIRLPGMLIQPFIENALKHGLALKDGPKKITIEFNLLDEKLLEVRVADNGIGRKKAAEVKEQQQLFLPHEPKGIRLVMDRLKLLDQTSDASGAVMTVDLYSASGDAEGTRVTIKIPLGMF